MEGRSLTLQTTMPIQGAIIYVGCRVKRLTAASTPFCPLPNTPVPTKGRELAIAQTVIGREWPDREVVVGCGKGLRLHPVAISNSDPLDRFTLGSDGTISIFFCFLKITLGGLWILAGLGVRHPLGAHSTSPGGRGATEVARAELGRFRAGVDRTCLAGECFCLGCVGPLLPAAT